MPSPSPVPPLPLRPLQPPRPSLGTGRTWGAVGVILATLGCTPPGPQVAAAAVEPLRQALPSAVAPGATLSVLQTKSPARHRLVLVHGTPGEATSWADYLAEPPPDTQVIALDRPGFGKSGPEGAVTTLAAQADAVAALLPPEGPPAVLLGHSMGGPIVAWVAATHPERVAALVLLAASLDPAQESIHPMQHVGAAWPMRSLLPRALRNANAELMALKPELLALAGLLPRITAPVVIVHGTQDDLVPVANVAYMQAHLTSARCVKTLLLEGQNHFLPWNAVPTVREAIRLAQEGAC